MLTDAGHMVVTDTPDVVLCDLGSGVTPPVESEAPVVMLTDRMPRDPPAGVLPREASAAWLDLALRAVAGGLLVRAPWPRESAGFVPAVEESPLTPRETEILTLIGQGMSNKAVARHLGISVHTVKFHLEALFARLGATNRAEAVAKGLLGGVIEL
jgi:DNA-binding NarL/FixJ family response regulator